MTNSKSTKRALATSALAILMCVAMLIGTTFAWFTDTASTSVNKIQAGTLDVALEMKDASGNWVSAEGETFNFIKAAGHEAEEILWEPGCTYELPEIRVINNGNLALKYKIVVSGINGNAKLLEAITFSGTSGLETESHLLPGAYSDPIKLVGTMKKEAGNEYQGLVADGIAVTVVATQDTVEYDSNDNQYDVDAEYPVVKMANDAASFAEALKGLDTKGNKNVLINVTKDTDNITGIKTEDGNSLKIDFGGNSVSVGGPVGSAGTVTNGMQLLKGSKVTLVNGTYEAATSDVRILIQNYADLTLDGVTLDGTKYNNCEYVASLNCGNVLVTGNTNIIASEGKVALDVMHWHGTGYEQDGVHVVIDENMTGTIDGKIDVYCYGTAKLDAKPGATLVIKGGTFKNTGLTLDEFKAYVADGYAVTEHTDGSWTVAAK